LTRTRDYKAEYARRIASAERRGLSRAQARGHAGEGELPARPSARPVHDDRLEAALKELRSSRKLVAAARSQRIAPERLRRFLRENGLAERRGRAWHITDNRRRQMTVITNGSLEEVILPGFDAASLNGRHLAAVRTFISTNDIELLSPFEGAAVIDTAGRPHPLETDPNALYRLATAGSELFHEVYRLII
jgi:hypothetical protein